MNKESRSNGIGFIGLLQIAFIVLKLCHVIDWSWWIVFAPVLGYTLFIALCFIIIVWLMD